MEDEPAAAARGESLPRSSLPPGPPGPIIEPPLDAGVEPPGVDTPPAELQFDPGPPPASLGRRALALIVDSLIAIGVFFFSGTQVAGRVGGATPDGFTLEGGPALLVLSIVGLCAFAYFVLFELAFGATLGKLVAGARVGTVTGGGLSLRAAVIRNLMRFVDGQALYLVGGITALLNKRRRRLGDLAAGTMVIRRDWPRPLRGLALVLALAAAVAGVAGGILLRPPSDPPEPRYSKFVLTDDRNVAVHKELFSPSTAAFFLLFTVADVPADTVLKAVWYGEQVQGEQPELKIDEAVVVAGGQRTSGDFSLARSSFSWPPGIYRADLFIGPRLAQSVRFRVDAPPGPGAAGASPPPSVSPASR